MPHLDVPQFLGLLVLLLAAAKLSGALAGPAPQALDAATWLSDMESSYTTPEQHALHGGPAQNKNTAETQAITFF